MAYQHKQILTRAMIERDLSPDPKETRLMATILLVVTLLVAAVATLFIFLIVPMGTNLDEDSPGIYVAVGVVWVIAAAIMIAAGKAVVRSCKPPQIPDFYVSKRRLDTISFNNPLSIFKIKYFFNYFRKSFAVFSSKICNLKANSCHQSCNFGCYLPTKNKCI